MKTKNTKTQNSLLSHVAALARDTQLGKVSRHLAQANKALGRCDELLGRRAVVVASIQDLEDFVENWYPAQRTKRAQQARDSLIEPLCQELNDLIYLEGHDSCTAEFFKDAISTFIRKAWDDRNPIVVVFIADLSIFCDGIDYFVPDSLV